MIYTRRIQLLSVFLLFLEVWCSSLRTLSYPEAEKAKTDGTTQGKKSIDPEVVNRWYFNGCLAGAASGYVIGFLSGLSELHHSEGVQDKLEKFDWPCGSNSAKEIESELNNILSNEPLVMDCGVTRYISSQTELPVRRAGIYSSYFASVQAGWKDAITESNSDFHVTGNRYLEKYVQQHASNLSKTVKDDLLSKNRIQMIE